MLRCRMEACSAQFLIAGREFHEAVSTPALPPIHNVGNILEHLEYVQSQSVPLVETEHARIWQRLI